MAVGDKRIGRGLDNARLALVEQTDGTLALQVQIPSTIIVTPPTTSSRVNSTGLEASRALKLTPGKLIHLWVSNTGTAQAIQLFDSTTVPPDGTVPVWVAHIPANGDLALTAELTGLDFAVGIAVCNSSTISTKTIGAANCFFTAMIL